jgi:hypothetical protein
MRLTLCVPMAPTTFAHVTRSQRGQSTVEWAGALILIALIVAFVVASGVGGQVSQNIECAIERVFQNGGGCQASSTASNPVPCPTSAVTDTASDEFQLFFIDAGHNSTLIKTVYSNGTVDYTLVDDGTLEAQAKLQAEFELAGVGFNAEASAAAGGELTGSYTFSFPNAAAASAFAQKVQSGGGWGVIAHDIAGGIPIAGPVASGLLNLVGIHGAPNGGSLAQQYSKYLTSAFVAEGAAGQVKALASGELGPVSAELGAELSGAAGFREVYAGDPADPDGPQKGDVQIYLKLDGNADGSLMQALFGPKAAAEASGSADAVVTLDSHGNPKLLEVTASGDAGGSGGVAVSTPEGGSEGSGSSGEGEGSGSEGDGSEGGGLLKSLDLSSTLGKGEGYQYTATLDLRSDPQAVQDLASLLNPTSAGPAMTQLVSQINTSGEQRLQPYQQSTSQTGGGIALEVADIGGGFNASVGSQNQHLFAGWVQNPGQAWEPVICER